MCVFHSLLRGKSVYRIHLAQVLANQPAPGLALCRWCVCRGGLWPPATLVGNDLRSFRGRAKNAPTSSGQSTLRSDSSLAGKPPPASLPRLFKPDPLRWAPVWFCTSSLRDLCQRRACRTPIGNGLRPFRGRAQLAPTGFQSMVRLQGRPKAAPTESGFGLSYGWRYIARRAKTRSGFSLASRRPSRARAPSSRPQDRAISWSSRASLK